MQGRRESRNELMSYLDVIDPISTQIIGYLGDISTEGMMMLTENPFNMHSLCELTLRMPQQAGFTKQWITVKVEVRWIHENTFNPQLRRVGFQFIHVNPEDIPFLKQLVDFLAQNT
ncbi:PilZ domain-containing protein [Beggiatoa alba B18LD]|uniref:PilZ domain-containing protein n=1 Tax=Beggiatoa alba B18LD TaxID=395493 RepID=I3CCH8_9GAMM|nr:PilZ domain-containing protein [Beggiatoa alba]EIJ41321.1 PilZ domain-containing protein [Beggiatoa alba B18LD]